MNAKTLFMTAGIATICMHGTAQTPRLGVDPIPDVIKAMTLDEKISIIVGSAGNKESTVAATIGNSSDIIPGASGQTNGIERLGIYPTVVADGPAGLRINPTREGSKNTFYCTHFPIETVMSATWNTQLVRQLGAAMGDEVKRYGVDAILAPATNIQRNPLNGRNFEYYSEDPLLSGKICASMVNGVQSNGVGTTLKHFALNNQETNRNRNDVIGTPRTFREIYLKPFEIVVKEAQPWIIMTSYNKINGTTTSERCDLLTNILRREWGFKGMVMTDWFGGQNVLAQMEAGNDMLMPGKLSQRTELKKAVLNGHLSMDIIDRNVQHILQYILRTPRQQGYKPENNPDLKAHAELTRNTALEGMVLLKNQKNTLPLHINKVKNVAVFGRTSYDFIAGGSGSGDVNHAYVVNLTDGLKNIGLHIDGHIQALYESYIPEAKKKVPVLDNELAYLLPKHMIPEMSLYSTDLQAAAQNNDAAIITIGKTSGEFGDRPISDNFNLTDAEKKMVSDVTTAFHKVGKRVIVILNVCGVIETKSWANLPDAILNVWLPGQEGGNSVADILSGKESPSGRLPMTWPNSYNDVPSKDNFPTPDGITDEQLTECFKDINDLPVSTNRKNFDYTNYEEGIYVGYRYYTTKNVAVSYPFGYGLSYTSFKYGKPTVTKDNNGNIEVSVNVKNTGKVAGKEVIQVYVAAPGKDMGKPSRELKGFAKTQKLAPGMSETVSIKIPYCDLASFNEQDSRWQVEDGSYKIMVAQNASDANPLTMLINVKGGVTEEVHPSLLPEIK